MALSVGTKAPLFTLKQKTSEGLHDVSLGDFIGQEVVVLLFVPGAFTGVCTEEFCLISNGTQDIPGAKVFGITVDSAFCQEGWAKAVGISIPMLSDFKHEVVAQYDVVLEDLAGLGPAAKRASFVIDRSGAISYVEVTKTPGDQIDFEGLKAAVSAAS